jgi:hypothetical protein
MKASVNFPKITSTTRLAAIAPSEGNSGFDWGTTRKHYLWDLAKPERIASDLEYWYPGGDYSNRIEEEKCQQWCKKIVSRILADENPENLLKDWDIKFIDLADGITDQWPSAGNPDHWTCDIWQGVADYLSSKKWSELAGLPLFYTFPDVEDLDCYPADIEKAGEYLPDGWQK